MGSHRLEDPLPKTELPLLPHVWLLLLLLLSDRGY